MVRSATCFYNDIEGNEMPEGDKMTELIQEKAAKSAGTPAPVPVDLEAVKARQQVMWSSGDYAVIGTTLQLVGESLCEAVDLVAGHIGFHLQVNRSARRAQPLLVSRDGRRRRTSAISADAAIRKRLTALSTGLAPSRILSYIMTVSGGSEPTSISVVLKFSKDIKNDIAAAPTSAGLR